MLPDPSVGPPVPDDKSYMLTTDPRLPHWVPGYGGGRWLECDYPIKIPIPARYLEALFYLRCRDWFGGGYCDYWATHICYISQYVEGNPCQGILSYDDLKEPVRQFIELRNLHRYKESREHLLQMRSKLIEDSNLPSPPGSPTVDGWTPCGDESFYGDEIPCAEEDLECA